MAIQNLTSAEIIKFHESGFSASSSEADSMFGEDGFSFGDILDIVNPLQHIPVLNTIYRKLTGDTIAPAMQIAGDALFGGPIGAAISVIKTAIKSQFATNKTDQDETAINPTTVASKSPSTIPTAIAASDYASKSNLIIDPATQSYQQTIPLVSLQQDASIGPIISMEATNSKNAEKYNDVINATTPTRKNIDIIIGNTADAG